MKSVIIILSLLITVSTVHVNAQHEHHNMGDSNDQSKASNSPTFKNDKLNEAYQHYIHLKSALVSSDVNESKMGAKMLATSLKDIQSGGEISSMATRIANSNELSEQRTEFAELSKKLYELIKGQMASGEIYYDYCPMANGNKGAYWLSSEKSIRNPYFGDKMMSCGSVREVLQ